MSTPSYAEPVSLTLDAYEPIVKGGKFRAGLTKGYTAYNHEILAVGGYWTAQVTLTLPKRAAEKWFEEGLGVQVKVYNPQGQMVWEGFTNQVTLNAGALSEIRGPLLNIGNRVSATYAPLDVSVYPPVTGSTTVTTINEDTSSQALYGIIEKITSAGTTTDENAEKVRDVYLEEYAYPETSGELSLAPGNAQAAQVTLDLLGHVHWLTAYVYNDFTAGFSYLSDKIKALLTADPNGVISTDFRNVADNLFLTPTLETDNRFAWDILQELVALGNDSDDTRRLFGVYANRLAAYAAMPTTVAYLHKLSDRAQRVTTPDKVTVWPWDVKPGKWLFVPDFLVGKPRVSTSTPAALRKDPRNKFLESVRYTAPYGLDLSGGKTDKLSQLVAKINYTGGLL